jgi:hypothetical protein
MCGRGAAGIGVVLLQEDGAVLCGSSVRIVCQTRLRSG